jgi:excisionase family DNA binding protein
VTNKAALLIDAEQLSEILGLSLPSIWRYCREGRLPHYRIGRRVLFDLEEVRAALKVEVRP